MIPITRIPLPGDIGIHVGYYQNALTSRGYALGKKDQIFGSKTKQATSRFQKDNGLLGTGIPGPKTLQLLGLTVVPQTLDGVSITRELAGRKDRCLHPTLRILMESKLFPNRMVPKSFKDLDIPAMHVDTCIALESLQIVEEGGNNRGQKVGFIQDIIGPYNPKGTGDAWCNSIGQCAVAMIEDYVGIESPVPASEGVMNTLTEARKIPGLVTDTCEVGSFFMAQNGTGWQGHMGSVLAILEKRKIRTFEGNTGSGSDRDGDGAYFRTRGMDKFAAGSKLVIKGYMRIFPFNKLPAAKLVAT